MVVHEHGQRDLRELVADEGQGLREPESAELAHRENLAVGRLLTRRTTMPAGLPSRHARSSSARPVPGALPY
ncbi:hypothetical protein GCM10010187_50910 [Actinomadura coerulea]|nr:hypothetical protein GCM10010187_50910 [Actinomadura coerulea]